MKTAKNIKFISASEAGRGAFCPHYLELQQKGEKPSNEAKMLRASGDEAHQKINKLAEDKRCFIASHLYGVDDPKTNQLRRFRNKYLVPYRMGRILVKSYYYLSPLVIRLAKQIPIVDRCLLVIVDHVRSYLENGDTYGR